LRPVLVPVPFGLWHALALVSERVPHPLITTTQGELIKLDSVASADCPGFQALGINPRGIRGFLAAQGMRLGTTASVLVVCKCFAGEPRLEREVRITSSF